MLKTKTYKVFSTLLVYPSKEIKSDIDTISYVLYEDNLLSKTEINKLEIFINYIRKTDLLLLQEKYVSVFDRQKKFSLYLFEHIHGDSRERGMAMVDLKNLYKASNFDIAVSEELPDYIPVFLEYLSLISRNKASVLLGEVINIIAMLGKSLKLNNILYYIIFDLLESLSSIKADVGIIDNIILDKNNNEVNNYKVDKDWEEPKVF